MGSPYPSAGSDNKTMTAAAGAGNKLGSMKLWRTRSRAQIAFGVSVLVPVLALYTCLRFVPMIQTFRFSLYDWSLAAPTGQFIGLANFSNLLVDDSFRDAFWNTLVFCVGTTLPTLVISLGLAVLLNRRIARSTFYELLFFVPVVLSMVPVSIVWKWIYEPKYGLLNYLVSLVGIPPKAWLFDPQLVMPAIIVMSIWKGIGFYLVIFVAGLRNIPHDYYDAAYIDGATWWSAFRFVTLPLLRPITLFALVWATIQNLNVFTQVYVMTLSYGAAGTFGRPLQVLVLDIYNNAFRYFKLGYASAEAAILFVTVLIVSLIQLRLLRERA